MPELGKYAVSVLSAYGATAVILGVLVVYVLRQSAVAKAALAAQETSKDG
jgi:heme exporter protein D